MDSKPLVSVVMPFLNAEKSVEEAIESVFAQTYDNWELLLVDDGSTDRSTSIAMGYVQKNPEKIRYLQHSDRRNHGIPVSCNLGIDQARGEIIAFLDADHVWLPLKIERQWGIMDQDPELGLVFNPVLFWYEDGTRTPCPTALSPGKHPTGAWTFKMLESDDNSACPSSVMMKKDLALAVGGFEETFRGAFQLFGAQAMWKKVGLNAPIYYDPEPMTLYRTHAVSGVGRASTHEQQLARIHLYAWLIQYLKQHKHGQFQSELQYAIVRFHMVWLRYFVDMEQFDAAAAFVRSLEQQLPEFPDDADLNYFAAFSLHRSQTRLNDAIDRYNLALKNGYDEFWVRYNRGCLHVQLGNLKEAREDLERAVELDPNHDGAQLVLTQLSSK